MAVHLECEVGSKWNVTVDGKVVAHFDDQTREIIWVSYSKDADEAIKAFFRF